MRRVGLHFARSRNSISTPSRRNSGTIDRTTRS